MTQLESVPGEPANDERTPTDRYYNDIYSVRELDLDERGNTFEKISRLWEPAAGKSTLDVLDLGCGAGSVSGQLVADGHRVAGLDIMDEAIRRAKARGLNATAHDLNAGIPFRDETFDFVLALDIIEHVFDPLSLLADIRRVLRPSGHAIVMVPLHFDLRQRLLSLLGRGIVHYEHLLYDPRCSAWSYFHIRFFTLSEVYEGISRSGFLVDAQEFRPMVPTGIAGLGGRLERLAGRQSLARTWPSLFSSGVLMRLSPTAQQIAGT